MKVSMNWLKDYVEIDQNYKLIEDSFNLMSQEVESLEKLVNATNLVIGHVLTCDKHPEADKLNVTTVDVNQGSPLQIICGAPNVSKNQKVIVALVGAVLPGDFKIKKAKIRGIESHGMICSLGELGVAEFDSEEDGIYVLGNDAVVGENPLEYLNLDDVVLNLDLTANRPDLLSMEGVAYDVACMLNKDITTKEHHYDVTPADNKLSISTDTDKCDAYYGQVIKNVTIKESPSWMKARLLASGIRPINNVVDITNYVLIEYGQPLHAFDYDKLGTNKIVVRQAVSGEKMKTLDDIDRELLESDIVITNGEKPVAIAGVMGGLDTEVDKNTKNIMLEAASFDPLSIRKTSKRLDLKSESSTRFEKGLDPNKIKKAMDYATELFVKLANGEVYGAYHSFDYTQKDENQIELSLDKLTKVTGHNFTEKEVKEILNRLRFDYKEKQGHFKISIPTRRQLVHGYQDVIEEIVRIYGYDKIPSTIPTTPTSGYLTEKQKLRRQVKEYFVNVGFNETVTYSLVSDAQCTMFDKEELSKIEIMNPLNKEKSVLRHSQLPSMIDVLQYNKKRKIVDINLFELGRAYTKESEKELLTGLMHGLYASSLWQGKKEPVDFFLLKGVIEGFLERLKVNNYDIVKSTNPVPNIHPGIHADVLINGKYAGFLGKLHPQLEQAFSLNKTFVFELDFDLIYENSIGHIEMVQIPKYPSINRDLAVIVDKDLPVADLLKAVKVGGKKQLVNISIFDVYIGEGVEESKKSVAMSLEFRSNEKTLETSEVDKAIQRILKYLERELQAKLR